MPPAQTSATFLAVLPVPAAMSRSQSPEPRASATAASSTPMRHVLHLPETSALALVDPELTLVTETSAREEGSGVDLVADPVDLEADPVDSVASRVDSVASRVDLAVNNSADSREALVPVPHRQTLLASLVSVLLVLPVMTPSRHNRRLQSPKDISTSSFKFKFGCLQNLIAIFYDGYLNNKFISKLKKSL